MTESVITFKLPKSLLNGLSEEKREITLIILKQNEEITRLWVNNLKKENKKLEDENIKLKEKLVKALDIENRPWLSLLTISYSFKKVTKVFYGQHIENNIVGNRFNKSTLNAPIRIHESGSSEGRIDFPIRRRRNSFSTFEDIKSDKSAKNRENSHIADDSMETVHEMTASKIVRLHVYYLLFILLMYIVRTRFFYSLYVFLYVTNLGFIPGLILGFKSKSVNFL